MATTRALTQELQRRLLARTHGATHHPGPTAIELCTKVGVLARDSPSPPSEGGEGRGEEGQFCSRPALVVTSWLPLSPTRSPIVPRGEREKTRSSRLISTALRPGP